MFGGVHASLSLKKIHVATLKIIETPGYHIPDSQSRKVRCETSGDISRKTDQRGVSASTVLQPTSVGRLHLHRLTYLRVSNVTRVTCCNYPEITCKLKVSNSSSDRVPSSALIPLSYIGMYMRRGNACGTIVCV